MAVPTDDADANVPNYLTDVDHAGLAILPLFADFLRSSADVVLVVEGTELPCHSQVLASESKVFKDMLEATSREKGAFAAAMHQPVLWLCTYKSLQTVHVASDLNAIFCPPNTSCRTCIVQDVNDVKA